MPKPDQRQREFIDSLKLIAPTSIVPQPSPLEFAVIGHGNGASKVVVLQMATVHGCQFYFLATKAADQMGDALKAAAGSGIVVVPAGALPR